MNQFCQNSFLLPNKTYDLGSCTEYLSSIQWIMNYYTAISNQAFIIIPIDTFINTRLSLSLTHYSLLTHKFDINTLICFLETGKSNFWAFISYTYIIFPKKSAYEGEEEKWRVVAITEHRFCYCLQFSKDSVVNRLSGWKVHIFSNEYVVKTTLCKNLINSANSFNKIIFVFYSVI